MGQLDTSLMAQECCGLWSDSKNLKLESKTNTNRVKWLPQREAKYQQNIIKSAKRHDKLQLQDDYKVMRNK